MIKLSEKTKKIVAVLVVIFFVVMALLPLAAVLVRADQKQEIKNDIKEIDEKKQDVTEQKKLLDNEIEVLQSNITALESEIRQDDVKLKILGDELAVATAAETKQYETFKKRVRVMYEHGSQGYLEVLLSSENLMDFLNRFELMRQISTYDREIGQKLKATRQTIEESKAAADQLRSNKVTKTNNLQSEKKTLAGKVKESEQLLTNLSNDKVKLEAQLKKIEQEEQRARQAAASSSIAGPATYAGGVMLWPAPGYYNISSSYGWRVHPVLGYGKLHTGTDIAAPYGAKAVAANSGTVVTAGWNNAYGNHVVINHGGGIMTLYAHGSKLTVTVGQRVERGQQVLVVGSTGYSTGAHLHFEVIKNGSVTDPMAYLK